MIALRRSGALALGLAALCSTSCSKPLRIGAIVSETGASAVSGEMVKKGLELARDEINSTGGVRGRSVDLIFKDDATHPEVGKQVLVELIEKEGVRIVLGAVSSPVTLGIAPICERGRVLLLSPTASAREITGAGEYVFRNCPSDVLEGTTMADFARDQGIDRVAIFAVKNDQGAGLKDAFVLEYEGRSHHVVRTFDFDEGRHEAFAPMVHELQALAPDGIYIAAYLDDATELIRRIRSAKIGSVLLAASSATENVVRLAGTAAENLVFPHSSLDIDSREPSVRSFVEAFRKRFSEEPDIDAAHGYDALKLIVLAIERTGSADPDAVRRGLLGIDSYLGASRRTAFNAEGDVVQYPRLLIARRGKAIPYESFADSGGVLTVSGRR